MNHWQLVIQDIWSVARYAMPVLAYVCLVIYLLERTAEEEYSWIFASLAFLLSTWLCMAGVL